MIAETRRSSELSILRLVEPIFAALAEQNDGNRVSNASSTASETARHPVSIRQDLQHYKDLFAKLRFSYVEQVTKEKFLRAVTADAPEIIDRAENLQLKESNAVNKQALSEKKEELRGMLADLEAQGRQLAQRYQAMELQNMQLEMLPVETEELESKKSALQARQASRSDNAEMNLSLEDTLALLAEREQESARLDAQIQDLKESMPSQEQQIHDMQSSNEVLERRKEEVMKRLRDSQPSDMTSEADYQIRWLRSVEAGMNAMMKV